MCYGTSSPHATITEEDSVAAGGVTGAAAAAGANATRHGDEIEGVAISAVNFITGSRRPIEITATGE